ncbi:MAG: hypothetical protein M3144_08710 [Actinomycetota bacterium]|nr:hypothetical protein [Actinomycetota bacterium]
MKRSLLVLTAAAVALSPLAATAAPAKTTKRTITYEYNGFSSGGHSGVGSFNVAAACAGVRSCWNFETVKGEKTIEIKGSAANVGIQVWSDGAYADTVELFCGAGKFVVSPKLKHAISVRTSLHDCGGVPTSGTLTATILGTK